MHDAAVAGLDPAAAWDRTPGELLEYIEAYRDRRELDGYMLYNLAGTIASMVLSDKKPEPWQAFPGVIQPKMRVMSDDELYASCLAWCGLGEEEPHAGG